LAHEQTPLSNDTIDSVLRHGEVGRAKDFPAPLVFRVEYTLEASCNNGQSCDMMCY